MEPSDSVGAARVAGYAANAQTVARLLSIPSVQMALEIGLRRKMTELVPLAFAAAERVLRNQEGAYGGHELLSAAKLVLDRAGYVPAKKAKIDEDEREPEQMSTDELHAMLERLEREIGERAAPIGERGETQALDAT